MRVASAVLMLVVVSPIAADEPYVSETFADLMKRAVRNDDGSIKSIRGKEDSTATGLELQFSISRVERAMGAVDIVVWGNWKNTGRVEFERYRLRIDAAIERELSIVEARRKRLDERFAEARAQRAAQQAREEKRRDERIQSFGNGGLTYLMKRDQVVEVIGPIERIERKQTRPFDPKNPGPQAAQPPPPTPFRSRFGTVYLSGEYLVDVSASKKK